MLYIWATNTLNISSRTFGKKVLRLNPTVVVSAKHYNQTMHLSLFSIWKCFMTTPIKSEGTRSHQPLKTGIIGAKPVHFAYILFGIYPYTLSYAFWGTPSPPLLRTYFMKDPFAEIGPILRKFGRFAEPFSECWVDFRKFLLLFGQVFFCHFTDNSGRFYNVFSCIFDILDHFLLIIFFEIFVLRHFEKLKNVRSLKSLLHEIASESRKF